VQGATVARHCRLGKLGTSAIPRALSAFNKRPDFRTFSRNAALLRQIATNRNNLGRTGKVRRPRPDFAKLLHTTG